jgi:hypothetical protein
VTLPTHAPYNHDVQHIKHQRTPCFLSRTLWGWVGEVNRQNDMK